MKKIFLIHILSITTLFSFGQNRTVDINDPILEIEIDYTKHGFTRLVVILNTIIADSSTNPLNSSDFEVNVGGLIHWSGETETKKKVLKTSPLQQMGTNKPYVLYADLYDGKNDLLAAPTDENAWEKLTIHLDYQFKGQSGQTPKINIPAPKAKDASTVIIDELTIEPTAIQKSKNTGIVYVSILSSTQSSGTPFEVTELRITKKTGANVSSNVIKAADLGDKRFALNGQLELEFKTDFEIEKIVSNYHIECKAKLLGTTTVLESKKTQVVFEEDFDLRIHNRKNGHNITVSSGQLEYLDENIETSGNGKLGVKFINPDYAKVKHELIDLGNGKFSIKLTDLSLVPNETASTFFYTDGDKFISGPMMISKKLPRVNDFKFNGVKEDSIIISFKLPGIDKATNPSIWISDETNNIGVSGNALIKLNETTKVYEAHIPQKITSVISNSDIVKDLTFNVKYGTNILYNVTVTVFNKKLYDEQMAILEEETEKRKNDRDPIKIKDAVKKIVEIVKAIGNSIGDTEVDEAISSLETAKGDKVKSVMSDIGKWALIAGKVILPFLI